MDAGSVAYLESGGNGKIGVAPRLVPASRCLLPALVRRDGSTALHVSPLYGSPATISARACLLWSSPRTGTMSAETSVLA
jgi:hypothetical protein